MAFRDYFRARWTRRIDVRALGPNEARILYDAGAAVFGAAATLAFRAAYLHGNGGSVIALVLLPLLSILCNAIVGVYSRFRTSAGSKKALALLAASLIAAGAAVGLGATLAEATLWVLLVYPPLALARLLLELPSTRHPGLIATAVNRRGPVLVIGGAGYIGSHAQRKPPAAEADERSRQRDHSGGIARRARIARSAGSVAVHYVPLRDQVRGARRGACIRACRFDTRAGAWPDAATALRRVSTRQTENPRHAAGRAVML